MKATIEPPVVLAVNLKLGHFVIIMLISQQINTCGQR